MAQETIFPDIYHEISEIPLKTKIQIHKNSLLEIYNFISEEEFEEEGVPLPENSIEEAFHRIYIESCDAIKNGLSASQQKDRLTSAFDANTTEELKNTYLTSFIWLVCAEFLEQEGCREQAWACLVEFSALEYRLELACMAEVARRQKSRHQKYGAMANARHANLKEYLIEFLHTESPNNGWKSVKDAACQLAPLILERHENSKHRSVYKISLSEIDTIITNWMYKNEAVKQAFNDKKRR